MADRSGSTARRGVGAPALGTPEADAHELELVRAIGLQQPGAWQELLSIYQDRIFAVCIDKVGDRELAADCAQDAMIKVIEGLHTYDGRSKLSTWIIKVTMNVCFSKLRSEKLRRHASLDGMAGGEEGRGGVDRFADARLGTRGSSGGVELPPQQGVGQDEDLRRIRSALERLPEEQRSLLVLRDCHGLEYEHIAEMLGVPVGTVKSRLFRARAALRELVEAGGGAEGQAGNES